MEYFNSQYQKKIKGDGFSIMFTIRLIIVSIIICFVIMSLYIVFKPDLSKPITTNDRLDVYDIGNVSVGDPLYGCPAPLENYIQLFTYKIKEKETVFNWVDEKATTRYLLPLYKENVLKKVLFLTRVSDDVFEANEAYNFEEYLSAKKQIENECVKLGVRVSKFRITIVTGGTYVILVDTDKGILGILFNPAPSGLKNGKPPKYNYSRNAGRIMNEQDLREMFIASK